MEGKIKKGYKRRERKMDLQVASPTEYSERKNKNGTQLKKQKDNIKERTGLNFKGAKRIWQSTVKNKTKKKKKKKKKKSIQELR